MKVVLRKFSPGSDSGIIYDTWPKGLYHAAAIDITTPKKIWFENFHIHMGNCLEDCLIRIACIESEPHTIIGYSVIDIDTLLWVYVKELYRQQGIATMLVPNRITKVTNDLTKLGKLILDARMHRGDSGHGRIENEQDSSQTH